MFYLIYKFLQIGSVFNQNSYLDVPAFAEFKRHLPEDPIDRFNAESNAYHAKLLFVGSFEVMAIVFIEYVSFLFIFHQYAHAISQTSVIKFWPLNAYYIQQLANYNTTMGRKIIDFEFVASVTSIVSATWTLWLILRIYIDLRRTDVVTLKSPNILLLGGFGFAFVSFIPFQVEKSLFTPSIENGTTLLTLQLVIVISSIFWFFGVYFAFAMLAFRRKYSRRNKAYIGLDVIRILKGRP